MILVKEWAEQASTRTIVIMSPQFYCQLNHDFKSTRFKPQYLSNTYFIFILFYLILFGIIYRFGLRTDEQNTASKLKKEKIHRQIKTTRARSFLSNHRGWQEGVTQHHLHSPTATQICNSTTVIYLGLCVHTRVHPRVLVERYTQTLTPLLIGQ
jgi:hypothetical protein